MISTKRPITSKEAAAALEKAIRFSSIYRYAEDYAAVGTKWVCLELRDLKTSYPLTKLGVEYIVFYTLGPMFYPFGVKGAVTQKLESLIIY